MATAGTAYRNSDEYESEKTSSPFTRIAQVRASTLAERHRNLIVAMLHKNRFGDELWMSTESICVVMGRVCYRRKIAETDSRGRKLGSCEQISRRAVQRLIDELAYCRECNKPTSDHPADHAFVPRVEGGGVLDAIYEANSLVPYGGGRKFRHTATYRLNPDKLVPRKTHDEYVAERDRDRARNRQAHRQESHREESQREQADITPIRKPAQPAQQPLPKAPPAMPPKKVAEHTSNAPAETVSHRLTRAEIKALASCFRGLANKKQEQNKQATRATVSVPAPRIKLPPERDPWLRVLRALEGKINRHSFETWLKPTRYSGESDGVLYVEVPTAGFTHASDKYADLIQEELDVLGFCYKDVKFVSREFVPPPSLSLTEAEVAECVEKACKLLSTSARPVSVEDGTVALRIAGVL